MRSAKQPNVVEAALGNALEWTIQQWVLTTGKIVRAEDAPWLEGPVGGERIGADFHEEYTRQARLKTTADDDAGLLPEFSSLESDSFDPSLVRPEIRDFYERTARYGLEVRAGWRGPLRYPPRTLIYLVSRNIQQLNLPASQRAASAGMTSELIQLTDPATRETIYAGWLRRSKADGAVIYAGFYTTWELPEREGRFVKVVFPLPGGSATVILRPENHPDGSFALVSAGEGFGDAGYYRVHVADDTLRARYVPLKEFIHVFVDGAGTLRTDHAFRFVGVRFLDLHYRITLLS